jgi:beta-fructofuranosidase
VLLFGCDDLRRWSYLGPLLDGSDPVAGRVAPADVWECPQLALVDGHWVLIVSLWIDKTLTHVAYLIGDLVPHGDGLRFSPREGGLVDHGSAFYAPALLVEEDRVLMWGWSWEDRDEELVAEAGWAGALTWPRVLTLHPDGRLLTTPAPELHALRATRTRFSIAGGDRIPLPAGGVDVELMVRTREAGPVTLRIGDVTGHLVLEVDAEEMGLLGIRVVIDGSLVEVYVAGGQTFTERRYPIPNGSWQLAVEGAGELTVDATVHRLAGTSP